ncbi:unnamed protein product [Pleuronectes platessa]|uniref:Uncharacterized protein n=1 Tax=Pleuronectes platessa TaxID=8262 RepID=A0A9N7VQP2_PLEPL|nr:unnamed protein product [Pleuronectes platessa]
MQTSERPIFTPFVSLFCPENPASSESLHLGLKACPSKLAPSLPSRTRLLGPGSVTTSVASASLRGCANDAGRMNPLRLGLNHQLLGYKHQTAEGLSAFPLKPNPRHLSSSLLD